MIKFKAINSAKIIDTKTGNTILDLDLFSEESEPKFYIENKVRAVEIKIGDLFHFDNNEQLKEAEEYLELEYIPNAYWNYKVNEFKNK